MTDTAPDAGQATQPAAWYEGAAPEVVGFLQNKGWTDSPLKVVDAYQNLEKLRGVPEEQLLKLPKDMADEKAMQVVYQRLGMPEAYDKYEIEIPEGLQVDQGRVDFAKKVAHSLGLNNKQVNKLVAETINWESQLMSEYQNSKGLKAEAEINDLKKEWGAAFDERAELGRRVIRQHLPNGMDKDATLDAIEDALGTANMLRFFGSIGANTGQAKIVDPQSGDRPYGYTPEQAKYDLKQLVAEISGDKQRLDNYNKGIGADIEKVKNFNRIIAGAR